MSLMILAACSGTGKSTITKELLSQCPNLRLSVSHTTRAPREGEIDGVHYHFIAKEAFLDLIRADAFVEYAEYAGNFYGTSHLEIQRMTAQGLDILFDVEIMGASNLKKAYPESVSCFVLPPSWRALEERLRNRGTETAESLEKRLNTGKKELKFAESFDFIVINDLLENAVNDLKTIYASSKLKTIFQKNTLQTILKEIND
jgi:guanylate kinase